MPQKLLLRIFLLFDQRIAIILNKISTNNLFQLTEVNLLVNGYTVVSFTKQRAKKPSKIAGSVMNMLIERALPNGGCFAQKMA